MIADAMNTDELDRLSRRGFARFAAAALLAAGAGSLTLTRVAAREAESGDDHGSGGHGQDDPPGDDHGSGGHGQDDPPGDDHGRHRRSRRRGRRR